MSETSDTRQHIKITSFHSGRARAERRDANLVLTGDSVMTKFVEQPQEYLLFDHFPFSFYSSRLILKIPIVDRTRSNMFVTFQSLAALQS